MQYMNNEDWLYTVTKSKALNLRNVYIFILSVNLVLSVLSLAFLRVLIALFAFTWHLKIIYKYECIEYITLPISIICYIILHNIMQYHICYIII